jgi:mono/diheme cytochrome c family protein
VKRPRARGAALILALLAAGCGHRPAAPASPSSSPVPAASPGAPAAASSPAAAAPAAGAPLLSYEQRVGREVFGRYCQTCHGETGAGDGFNAFNLDPRPRNLSEPAFQKTKSDADLEDAIRRGGAGVGLTSLMPPWGRTLSGRQIEAVVRYLRTLRRNPG